MYDRFVGEWVGALDAACDLAADGCKKGVEKKEMARVCQTLLYGLVAHTYIGTGGRPDLQALSRQLRGALHGYLAGVA